MNQGATSFTISLEVLALGINCAVFCISGIQNKHQHPKFEIYKSELFAELIEKYSVLNLKQDPVLHEFEILHKKVGCSDKSLIASPQVLITALLNKSVLPSINLLVDIYNCISIQSKLSIGAHDLDKLNHNITLKIADGTEQFIPLGKNKPEKINAGEYCYIDDDNRVICRLECRQTDVTKISLNTRNALIIVQGNAVTSYKHIISTMNLLQDKITNYCGGSIQTLWLPYSAV